MMQDSVEITEVEREARKFARRSIVAATSLSAGTILTSEHLAYKRPGTGISPTDVDLVIGKQLTHNVEEDALITQDDIETTN
jgi:N-acetylneuraminate synthase